MTIVNRLTATKDNKEHSLYLSLSLLKLSLKMFTMVTASGCKMKNKQLIFYNTYTNTFYSTHFIIEKLGKRVLLWATMKITYQIKIIN